MPKHSWNGTTAVVCGATAGLGKALVQALAQSQVGRLALLAREGQNLENLKASLQLQYPKLEIGLHSIDLCNAIQVEQSALAIQSQWGCVDLLIQAVGKSDRGTICDLRLENLKELIDLNVTSSLNAIQHFRPILKAPGGTIVLIGSLACVFAPRFLGGYAIAKHALAALAQQTRLELERDGLHVLLACPGPIARNDAGQRYTELALGNPVPDSALKPGGGAKLQGLDPAQLATDILQAAAARKPMIIRPRKARLLLLLAALSTRLGDSVLKRKTS